MRIRAILMFCGAVLLAACSSAPPAPSFAPITFTDSAAMRVNAPSIAIQEEFVSPLAPPHVEYEMPVRPVELVRAWVRDRLRPIGSNGTFRVIIKDASVVAEKLATKGGIEGALTTQQGTNLIAKISVELDYESPEQAVATTTVNIYRTQTLAEDLSINDRDKAYYQLAKDLAADLNKQLESNVSQNMRDALL